MKLKKALIAVFILLAIASIGIYVYDIVANGTPYTKNLFKVSIVVVSFGASIAKLLAGRGSRTPLTFYEKQYAKELGGVFARDPKSRKKLLEAIRLFNENKHSKAISSFEKLKALRPSKRDLSVVCIFSALCYEDWGLTDEAIREYKQSLANDPQNATVLSNLGVLYAQRSDFVNAEDCYQKAIEVNPSNHFAINNLAQLYYREGEYEGAVEYSLDALEICPDFKPAASLLAIIYGGYGYEKEYAKYLKIAVQAGADRETIEKLAEAVSENIDEGQTLPDDR